MQRVNSSSSISSSTTTVMSNQSGGNASETLTYLQCYEAMVRHQDQEFEATSAHMKEIASKIKYLGRKGSNGGSSNGYTAADKSGQNMEIRNNEETGMITYLEMRRCLLRLGCTWNRSIHQYNCRVYDGSTAEKKYYYDDDVSVGSENSSFSGTSGGTGSSSFGLASNRNIISTDNQLIMLLTTLVEMEERYRAKRLVVAEEKIVDDEDSYFQGLTLPEFIQAYKVIIGGMQSLQCSPEPKSSRGYDQGKEGDPVVDFRTRSRERTLGLLQLFGPNVGILKSNRTVSGNPAQDNHLYSPERIPKAIVSPRRLRAASPSSRKLRQHNFAKDGLEPRKFNEDSIRKLVHSKDAALAKIMEEHELEMNVIKTNMEALRSKERRSRVVLRQRRARTRNAILAVSVILIAGGLIVEYQRRQRIAREIALGREVERKKTAEKIVALKQKKETLSRKLADAEGVARFEERRYNTLEKEMGDWGSEIEDIEVKWLIDQGYLETCKVSSKTFDFEASQLKSRIDELEEEAKWCASALHRAQKKTEAFNNTAATEKSFNNGSAERSDIISTSEAQTNNPVKLEMKYNSAFRKGVILRQAYSAVAGVATSFALQRLLPIALNFFAPTRVIAPIAQTPVFLVNSVWMDRIEFITVAGLIGRSLALFFLP
mmetsp:Transcript_27785/g.55507  ORF Transcript_27785/g.55507 Transcript_27785/m.55507 type:complete len:657 (-) Transcript_27785:152-2122(-)